MPFEGMMNDIVTLVKSDGTIAKENMAASVQSRKIFTMDASVKIEPGDHFLRKLPNGLVEDFVVEDPNYYAAFHGIPANYQSKVRRAGSFPDKPQSIINHITNNVSGQNARINVNSTDSSTNIASEIPVLKVAGLIEQIRPALASLPEPQRVAMEAPVALLEDEIRSGNPDPSRVRDGLQSIKAIAEGAAGNLVATGIIGLISTLLNG